ncbi:MAG: outer membrane beta-barrel protein [Bacteroidales bacterium]
MKACSFLLKLILLCLILFTGFACLPTRQAKAQYCYNFNFHKKEKSLRSIYLPGDSTKHKKNNTGFYFGANLGFYFANRYTAQYYNGNGVNKVDSVINHYYNYQNIKNILGYDTFSLSELPKKMKYSPAILLGFFVKYNFNNSGIFMQLNYAKLKAKDVFTIKTYDPYNPSLPIYKQEEISGAEKRTNIDIGYSYTFCSGKKYRPFAEIGFNINDTKFMESKIKIEGAEYSLVNPYFTYHNLKQSGNGIGAFFGAGIEINFNQSISLNPTFNVHYQKINLGNYNDKFKPNYSLFVRIILNGLL